MDREGLWLPLQERRRKSKSDFLPGERAWRSSTRCAGFKHRKLSKQRIDDLAAAVPPTSPRSSPSRGSYTTYWDWIETAGRHPPELRRVPRSRGFERRDDEGVARAMELAASYPDRDAPAPITTPIPARSRAELMGAITFAGRWRGWLTKVGPKWPLPCRHRAADGGIRRAKSSRGRRLSPTPTRMSSRSPAKVMNELLAIHPRSAKATGAPRSSWESDPDAERSAAARVYDRRTDEDRYFAAARTFASRRTTHRSHAHRRSGKRRPSHDGRPDRWLSDAVNVRAILADADLRRALMVSTIQTIQHARV